MRLYRCYTVTLLLSIVVALSCACSAFGKSYPRDAVYPLLSKVALKRVKSLINNKTVKIAFAEGTTPIQKRYIIDVLTGKKTGKKSRDMSKPEVEVILGCGLCGF